VLELLQLAGINRLSIVLGKLFPKLLESSLLISVQIPFTLLAVTLGGVASAQLGAAYLCLFTYLWFSAGVGIWCSARASSGRVAVLMTTLVLGLYHLPWLGLWITSGLGLGPSDWGRVCLPIRMWEVTDSGFSSAIWGEAVTLACLGGSLLILASWRSLEGRLSRPSAVLTARVATRRSERPWRYPLIWKEYRFLLSYWPGWVVRSLIYLGLLGWMCWVQRDFSRAFAWTALVGAAISLLDSTWTASRLFADEVHERTWSVLVLTPHPVRQLAGEKGLGWLLGHAPTLVIPYGCIVGALVGRRLTDPISFPESLELIIGSLATGAAIVAYLHLLAINSLSSSWKAIPLTLTICLVGAYAFLTSYFPWQASVWARNGYHALMCGGLCVVTIALQARLLHLLSKHAGDG
jgi:hypothetical protein